MMTPCQCFSPSRSHPVVHVNFRRRFCRRRYRRRSSFRCSLPGSPGGFWPHRAGCSPGAWWYDRSVAASRPGHRGRGQVDRAESTDRAHLCPGTCRGSRYPAAARWRRFGRALCSIRGHAIEHHRLRPRGPAIAPLAPARRSSSGLLAPLSVNL